jgi:hypothetical protein
VITADRWYDQQPDATLHYQGDVVKDIPFPTFPPSLPATRQEVWPLLRPSNLRGRTINDAMAQLPVQLIGRAAREVPDGWNLPSGEFAATHFKKQNVILISRSCALDNPSRKHCTVAPVREARSLPEAERRDDKLRDLRENDIPHLFYLPAKDGLAESYADLLLLTPVHRSFFPTEAIGQVLVARLSSAGMMALQHTMSAHFGTKFGFDHEDVCTQTGRYSCSNCFHSGMATQTRTVQAQQPFSLCPACAEDAMWVKLP